MSRHSVEFRTAGTSALKAAEEQGFSARIIEFPGAMDGSQKCEERFEQGIRSHARACAHQAVSGITRESLRGTSFGRMSRVQSAALGCAGFAFALAVMLIGA